MNQWVALTMAAMIGAWISIFVTVTLPYILGIVFYDSTKIDRQTKTRSSSLQS